MTSPARSGPNGNGKRLARISTKERPAPGSWRMGMFLFLTAISVLFAATIVATFVIRSRTGIWPPPGLPPPPSGLWISTAILALSSAAMEWSVRSIRRDRRLDFRAATLAATLLGFAFLATQIVNWFQWVGQSATIRSSLYAYLFYVMTGIHALHVLGGLVPLVVVTVNAAYDRYSSVSHEGVLLVSTYWHFLGVVWAVLLAVIFATS